MLASSQQYLGLFHEQIYMYMWIRVYTDMMLHILRSQRHRTATTHRYIQLYFVGHGSIKGLFRRTLGHQRYVAAQLWHLYQGHLSRLAKVDGDQSNMPLDYIASSMMGLFPSFQVCVTERRTGTYIHIDHHHNKNTIKTKILLSQSICMLHGKEWPRLKDHFLKMCFARCRQEKKDHCTYNTGSPRLWFSKYKMVPHFFCVLNYSPL